MDPNNQNHHQLLPPQDPPSYSALPQFPVSHPPPAALTPHHAPSASPSFAGSAAPLQQQQTFETPQSQRQSSTQDQPTRSVKTKSPSSSRRAANSDARLRVFSSTSVQRHRLSNFSLSSEPPVSTTPTRPPDDTPLPDSMKEMLTKMVEWKHRYPVMFSQVLQIFQVRDSLLLSFCFFFFFALHFPLFQWIEVFNESDIFFIYTRVAPPILLLNP